VIDPGSVVDLNRRHTLFTWTAQAGLHPPLVVSAERCHYTTATGQRVLDLASGVFNANAGLHHPAIADAIAAQARTLCVAAPYMATEIRGRTGQALAAITPRGLDRFLFTLGGADAVEHAIKIARLVTGRSKIVARQRSYHGATLGALAATGDERRDPFEPWLSSIVRLEDPYCYRCPWDTSPDRCARPCADHIEETIEREGPSSIAAVIVEAIPGTNGAFVPPREWLPRLREVCDRHEILLIADEVLTGFGRTGRWFATEHTGVTPDMLTLGKAITSGHAPLGAVAVSERVARHFDQHPLVTGMTHTAHPIALAAALANVTVLQSEGLVARAAALESTLLTRLRAMQARHAIVGEARCVGLYGVLELVKNNASREPFVPQGGSAASAAPIKQIAARLQGRGVHVSTRWNFLFVAPPLCIEEHDLHAGLDAIDEELGRSA
jgi:taurine--2-oxoglutarate transaminase